MDVGKMKLGYSLGGHGRTQVSVWMDSFGFGVERESKYSKRLAQLEVRSVDCHYLSCNHHLFLREYFRIRPHSEYGDEPVRPEH